MHITEFTCNFIPEGYSSSTVVFHQHCLRPWLEKNTECPCCREVVLICDAEDVTEEKKRNMLASAKKAASEYRFCGQHGLIQQLPLAVTPDPS